MDRQGLKLLNNSIDRQRLTHANQLTVEQWNIIINALVTQSNDNTTYLKQLHDWLISSNNDNNWYDKVNNALFKLYYFDFGFGTRKLTITNLTNPDDVTTIELPFVDLESYGAFVESITAEVDSKQDQLTAGTNIVIGDDNTISAVDTKYTLQADAGNNQIKLIENNIAQTVQAITVPFATRSSNATYAYALGNDTDGSYTYSQLVTELENIRAVAEGKNKAYVTTTTLAPAFNSQSALIIADSAITTKSGSISLDKFNIGDIIYIENLEVPDRWVCEIVKTGTTVTQVKFSILETAKVDLSGYALASELLTKQDIISVGSYLTKNGNTLDANTSKVMTVDTKQENITGRKTFTNDVWINNYNYSLNLGFKISFGSGGPDSGRYYTSYEKNKIKYYNGIMYEYTFPAKSGTLVLSADLASYVTTSAMQTALADKQDVLTAGEGITITNNVISAQATGSAIDIEVDL